MKSIVSAVVVSLAASAAYAQPTRFQQVNEYQVTPVHQQAFEGLVAKVKEAAEKTGSSMSWNVYQAAVGRPNATYGVTLEFDSWGERDQWSSVSEMLIAVFGAQEAARMLRAGRAGVTSETSSIWQRLPDASSNPRGSGPARYYAVTIRHVKRDLVPEYRELQRRWKTAYEAVDDGPSVGRSVLSIGEGSAATFRRAVPFDSWAERDTNSELDVLGAQLGEEGSRLSLETRDDVLEGQDSFIVAHRPDLSRTASTSSSD